MDEFDKRILRLVQQSNRLTSEQLSEEVGLSATACQKRLKRLRESGVIVADVAIVDPVKIGRSLTLVVGVRLVGQSEKLLAKFTARMQEAPEVQQCYFVTGEDDCILIVSARDIAEYRAFCSRYFVKNPNVTNFLTRVVTEQVKMTTAFPVVPSENQPEAG
ncbi:Lrp/AsnC family transcriptional regulator [Marivita sp.]|uniref:Lrp/AsnC family transcriptional regulator n=1 Tax=Marivita sp. TaxID=2003365 RepID=UPI003A889BD7